MADRIKGITIQIDGDTTKLSESLKSVNKEIKETQSALKDVDKLLKLDPGNVELLTQKHQMLGKEVESTKDKLQKLKEAQAQMSASGVDKTSDEYQALEREIIDCEQALKKLEKAASESNVTMQKVAAAGDKLKTVGSSITNVGKEVSKASAAVATVGAAAVKTTMDFDSQMSKVKAISGATEEEFQALRDKAREMGASTKFSATEAGEALEYMAMAGWKSNQMIEGLDGIMNLAAASGEELGTTSDIVTDALTAFGLQAKDSAHFADVLAASATNSNTNVSMLGESFKYVAPVMGSMSYSAEDTAVALGLMANSGVKASQAGTSLRNIVTRMAKPTKEVSNAMETLGVRLDDGQGNMLSLMQVMKQLRAGFGDLKISEEELAESMSLLDSQLEEGAISEAEYDSAVSDLMDRAYGAEGALKAEAAAALAGKNSLSGLLAIVNASDEDFNKLTQAIYGADGTAQRMADTMNDNLAGQLTILKSQLQELAISIGDIMMPTLRKAVEGLQNLVDKFNGMSEGQKKAVIAIGAFIVVLGPLLVIIGKLIFAIGAIMTYGPAIAGALGTVAGLISGPVLIAILAVIAAITVWVTKWDEIKAGFQAFGEIVSNTLEIVQNKIDIFKRKVEMNFEKIKSAVQVAWSAIKTILGATLPTPKIKLPHIKISGGWSWNPPKAPSFSIDWYKKAYDDAYLLNSPTIFGMSGNTLLGGGEGKGSEAIVGTDKLMSMMSDVVGSQNVTVVLEGDAGKVFQLVRTENSRFMKSNGYSPLMG